MGHSSIQVTFDTYGHLFEQVEQNSAVASAIEQSLIAYAAKNVVTPTA